MFKCSFWHSASWNTLFAKIPVYYNDSCNLQSASMWPRSWSRALTCDPKLDVKNPQDCFRLQLHTYNEDESVSVFCSFLQQGCQRMISFKINLVIYSWTKTCMYIIKLKFLYCITTVGCIIFGQETSRFLFHVFLFG